MSKAWTSKDIPSQTGKRNLITGGSSGIGWNTALELAQAGAEVTIPARMQVKAADAVTRIRPVVPQAKLKTAVMDLSSLKSVRAFAAQQLADPRPIDTLINNAGVMAIPKRKLSVDGFEMPFATNVLGHFLLTGIAVAIDFAGTCAAGGDSRFVRACQRWAGTDRGFELGAQLQGYAIPRPVAYGVGG